MKVGNEMFVVKTLAGDYVTIRHAMVFARNDAKNCEELTGQKCIIFRVTVEEMIEV